MRMESITGSDAAIAKAAMLNMWED